MKIAILTIYNGQKFIEDTIYGKKTIINYCKKHCYDFIDDTTIIDNTREIQWSKILLIQKYLQKDYDYLVWIDADIIILNDEKKIEHFIERLMGDKQLMYSKDFGSWVNNGVIFIKNTPFMLEYFQEVYKHTNEICREQGSMDFLWRINWKNCRNVIAITEDPTEYNSYWGAYKYGQFIIHFAGCGEPSRPPNSLRKFMDMFCPIKMEGEYGHPTDNNDTFKQRLYWLKNTAEDDLQQKKYLCSILGKNYPFEI